MQFEIIEVINGWRVKTIVSSGNFDLVQQIDLWCESQWGPATTKSCWRPTLDGWIFRKHADMQLFWITWNDT